MDELDMSVSRSWTKIVIASRYSSPVIVMLPSVAVPTVVLSIVSIVVMTDVAAAELTVTVFILLKRNVDTVSVVAVQLPPGKCLSCILGNNHQLYQGFGFRWPFPLSSQTG